jgi:competence protein ComEC
MTNSKLKQILIGLLLLVGLIWALVAQSPDNRVHLVFCDVGQGDAALISYRNTQILIDGGPNDKVLDCLSRNIPFTDRTIEMVILTHANTDHYTGLISVIERYDISQFVINSLVENSTSFWEFRRTVLAEGAPVYSPQAGDELKIDPLKLTILWPKGRLGNEVVWKVPAKDWSTSGGNQGAILGAVGFSGDLNDTSITLELKFGNFKALFPGDLSSLPESDLSVEDVDILKVAHHGSKTSTSVDFLSQIKPELAIISLGKNSYGHPAKELLDRLAQIKAKVLRTDEMGEIKITSDGQGWQIINQLK